MRNLNAIVLSAVDITTNPSTAALDSNQLLSISYQAVLTGSSPMGTLKLQASNDFCNFGNLASDFTPTHWTDLTSQTVSITGTGTFLIPKLDLCYRWMRAVYTNASGTGTITVTLNALGV